MPIFQVIVVSEKLKQNIEHHISKLSIYYLLFTLTGIWGLIKIFCLFLSEFRFMDWDKLWLHTSGGLKIIYAYIYIKIIHAYIYIKIIHAHLSEECSTHYAVNGISK